MEMMKDPAKLVVKGVGLKRSNEKLDLHKL